MNESLSLFAETEKPLVRSSHAPLAERLRPQNWEELAFPPDFEPTLLKQLREGKGRPPSLIFWGPPGSGKTTLARLIGSSFQSNFVEFSAVLSGVKDVREVVEEAEHSKNSTILFVDEIHRFNKAQQDAFLPHIERGTIVLIGATTENPSFALTGALLSRCRLVVLPPHSQESLSSIVSRGMSTFGLKLPDEAVNLIVVNAGGDARRALGLLERIRESLQPEVSAPLERVREILGNASVQQYDRSGEEHYNIASAFIKSLRGSDPDAALFWGFKMIEGGEDPRFLFRRLIIFASEDVGNADPRALQLAVSASDAFERIGFPEGKIPLAQCITYLATAPKSNRSYVAMHEAIDAVKEFPNAAVPLHLRNAPTKMMKHLGYGDEYRYPHNEEGAHANGEVYLPKELIGREFYRPSNRGLEGKILEIQLERRKGEKR